MFLVTVSPSAIGRAGESQVHLPFSGVSRVHARLIEEPSGQWVIEDMGGRNGTLRNGHYLQRREALQEGDELGFGVAKLVVSPAPVSLSGPAPELGTSLMRSVVDLQREWVGTGESDKSGDVDVRVDRLTNLVEIAKALNMVVSIEAIFDQVKESAFRHLPNIDRIALLVDVVGDGQLELLNSATREGNPQSDAPGDDTWVSRSICQHALTNRAAVQTADAQLDDRFDGAKSIVMKKIRTAIAVPLWNQEQVVGVLYADARIPSNLWHSRGEEDLGFFSALSNLVAATVQRWQLDRRIKGQEEIRRRFERYHSPAVVQALVASGLSTGERLRPRESDISVLFADIVGFTALAEQMSPTDVADMLNRFFEEMLQEVFAQGGTLDKFIGDCVMAFFGAPEDQGDHAPRAVVAAQGMLRRLDELNRKQVFGKPLQLRLAVHSGRAVVGDVGSSQRLEYTALGSTINLASRLESFCSPDEVVISESTFRLLPTPVGWAEAGAHEFRGIEQPVNVYRWTL
jgi:adenylate cyclase